MDVRVRRLWLLAYLLVCTSARADSTPTRADQLFEQGRQLMDAGKYADACAAFEESQQLDPAITTLLNLGACREKGWQLASAVTVFQAAERTARAEGTPKGQELAQIAASHVQRLEPRLSTLTVQIPRAHRISGLVVERDGLQIDARLWDLPFAIDGGTYRIVARASGHDEWSTTIVVANERATATVRVPALVATVATSGTRDRAPEVRSVSGRSKVWPLALGVSALVAGGGAVVFALRGDATYDKAKLEPIASRQDGLWHDANRQRYLAEGFAVAGVGCAAIAVWLLVRGDGRASTSVALQPSAHDGFAVSLVRAY